MSNMYSLTNEWHLNGTYPAAEADFQIDPDILIGRNKVTWIENRISLAFV